MEDESSGNTMDRNPDAPPEFDPAASSRRSTVGELLPLWVWLAVSVFSSWFSSPADPISTIIALVFGLICFCAGALLVSLIYVGILAAVVCLALSALVPVVSFGWSWPYSVVVSVAYSLASIAAGAWACRSTQRGRLRILVGFSLGYVVGCLFGALGVIAGAVAGAILAQRSLHKARTGSYG